MNRDLPRRSLMASAAISALGTATLAGCTSSSEDEEPWHAAGTTPQAVSTTSLDLEGRPPGPSVEGPSSTYRVMTTALLPSLTHEQLVRMFPGGSPPHREQTAAEGTVFLVAAVSEERREHRRWPLEADVEASRRIRFTDSAGDRAVLELAPEGQEDGWLLQMPVDPAPEDAVLEIEIAGKVRQLSLVDASLVRDDLAYLENPPLGLSVRTGVPEHEVQAEAEAVDEEGVTDAVSLSAGRGYLVPVISSMGWPAEGSLLAGVTVHHRQHCTPSAEQVGERWPDPMELPSRLEGCTLTLPDGTVIPQTARTVASPDHVIDGVFDGGSRVVWFEVPASMESATVQLRLALSPRRADLAEILAAGTNAEAELRTTEEQEQ